MLMLITIQSDDTQWGARPTRRITHEGTRTGSGRGRLWYQLESSKAPRWFRRDDAGSPATDARRRFRLHARLSHPAIYRLPYASVYGREGATKSNIPDS